MDSDSYPAENSGRLSTYFAILMLNDNKPGNQLWTLR